MRGSYSVTLFPLEIVPPPVCPQRVRDDARCDCSTCHCGRKWEGIVSLSPVPVAARRSVMSPTLSIKLIRLSATRCFSPRSLVWVFASQCFSLLLWDINCNCQRAGRWMSQCWGVWCTSGWRYSPLPSPTGIGAGQWGQTCHPMPCCDRCYPIVQSRAWNFGLRLTETTEVGTHASRLRRASSLWASAPLASRSGGVFSGKWRGLVIQGTQQPSLHPPPNTKDITFGTGWSPGASLSSSAKQEMSQAGKHTLTWGIALIRLEKRPSWRYLLFLGKEDASGHHSLRWHSYGLSVKGGNRWKKLVSSEALFTQTILVHFDSSEPISQMSSAWAALHFSEMWKRASDAPFQWKYWQLLCEVPWSF